MKNLKHSPLPVFFFILHLLLSIPPSTSQLCLSDCGVQPLRYPFGSGPGCGDQRFQQYVTCKQQKLTLTTHTGTYPITDIDYSSQIIYLSDPSMSTCDCSQPSKGFGLDWDAPFSFLDDNVFALLDCSLDSSSIYRPNADGGYNSSAVRLCDAKGQAICSFLNSCRAISMLNLPISTCCVYAPVDLGPSYEMDLQKLKCSSYSGIYSFNGQAADPENWKYGIALKYKFNVYNNYPDSCSACERSSGVCGYDSTYNNYLCVCPNGMNTSSDCFFGALWSKSWRAPTWHKGVWLAYSLVCALVMAML
ncbi:hypothetical protein SAY86_031866 [Trapa natans]|uniref:non-specific serine/threonine protein kinase n=1 Tax=Trapa natans TaxID=22666 RepID=A0AAN7M4F2_TRANT|nr:hypothetical protein SAY86_031866 [Trapa natans]